MDDADSLSLRVQLQEFQEQAEYVASSLGFECFESLVGWVAQGDALKSRLRLLQSPQPRSLLSSTKKGEKSTIQTLKKCEARGATVESSEGPSNNEKNTLEERYQDRVLEEHGKENISLTPPKMLNLGRISAENDELKASARAIQRKLQVLQEKYDALLKAKAASEEKYKIDYKKWKNFKEFIRTKETRRLGNRQALSSNEKAANTSLPSLDVHSKSPVRSQSLTRHRSLGSVDELIGNDGSSSNVKRIFRDVAEDENIEALSNETSTDVSASKTLIISEVIRRGRYNQPRNGQTTINADFEINREANDGVAHQYDEVVRDRSRRPQMHAGDCDCCKDYYDQVKPAPVRNGLMWRSPTPVRVRKSIPSVEEDSNKTLPSHPHQQHDEDFPPSTSPIRVSKSNLHRQQISRHRYLWAPPATPPDYWTIAFPDTQRAAEINKQANDMHADKRRRVEEEASAKKGRYVRREKTER